MSFLAASIVSTSFAPVLATSAVIQDLASSVLDGLTIEHEPEQAIGVLRETLLPLSGRGELIDELHLPAEKRVDFDLFLSEADRSPSEGLLRALQTDIEALRVALQSVGLTEVIRAAAAGATEEQAPPAGPLEYEPRRRAEALAAQRGQVDAAVARLFRMAEARAGVRVAEVPPALSLDYIVAHPEEFQDKPLEIVLADVDDTTRRGQMYLEWAFFDVLRYGPKSSVGVSLWRALYYGGIKGSALRKQEKEEGHADEEGTRNVVAQALNGLDPVMARKSLDRYYEVFGRRGIVSYMREEFDFHRSEGRLILLVSASPEYLVRRHAEDIGLPPDNAFGTRVDVDEEGKVSFTLLRSDQKVTLLQEEVLARLDEAGINYKITHAYSDSDSDIPMFELTREQGGVVISTNAPREVFERKVLAEMDGIAVRDRRDARETVLFDDADAGQLIHRDATVAPTPTYWREDLKSYGKVAGQSAAAFAVAASLVTLLVGAMPGGTADLSDVFLNGGFGAFGGGVGRVGGHFFTPKSGHISERRRWFMEYGGPLTSAMVFAGMYPGALETLSGTPTLGALFATAMVAGGAIQKATKALRGLARGLGWHSVDRAGQGITGETLMRTTEVAAYSGLGYLLSLLG